MQFPGRISSLLAALLSGLLLTLLFAPFNLWPLGWICLVPLLWAVATARTKTGAALLGLIAGLTFWLTSIPWIVNVMGEYGKLPWVASLGSLLLLSLYLSLYPATIAFLLRGPLDRFGPAALFLVPYLWVAGELLQTHLLTGFPWNLLGYSQIGFLAAIQVADITGVYGVSFLLLTVNCALAFALLHGKARSPAFWRPLAIAAAVLLAALLYGFWKTGDTGSDGDRFRVALIQDDLTNAERLRTDRLKLFNYYMDSSREAARDGAELILWSEGALLFLDMNKEDRSPWDLELDVFALANDERIWLLIGTNDYFNGYDKLYNSAFTIGPGNALEPAGKYDKVHLTPFGEYVPYKWIFGWLPQVVEEIGEFEAGGEIRPLPLREGTVGVPICYEIIFPDLVRGFAARGAGLLATISNDAWFGRSAANDQHFNMAVLRAVENRRYLVRCASTGVSGIIAPDGTVLRRTPIYERAVVRGEVAMRTGTTIYTAVGDLFGYLCALIALLSLLWVRYTKGPRRFRPVENKVEVEKV